MLKIFKKDGMLHDVLYVLFAKGRSIIFTRDGVTKRSWVWVGNIKRQSEIGKVGLLDFRDKIC